MTKLWPQLVSLCSLIVILCLSSSSWNWEVNLSSISNWIFFNILSLPSAPGVSSVPCIQLLQNSTLDKFHILSFIFYPQLFTFLQLQCWYLSYFSELYSSICVTSGLIWNVGALLQILLHFFIFVPDVSFMCKTIWVQFQSSKSLSWYKHLITSHRL